MNDLRRQLHLSRLVPDPLNLTASHTDRKKLHEHKAEWYASLAEYSSASRRTSSQSCKASFSKLTRVSPQLQLPQSDTMAWQAMAAKHHEVGVEKLGEESLSLAPSGCWSKRSRIASEWIFAQTWLPHMGATSGQSEEASCRPATKGIVERSSTEKAHIPCPALIFRFPPSTSLQLNVNAASAFLQPSLYSRPRPT